jgi:hypothetical protein
MVVTFWLPPSAELALLVQQVDSGFGIERRAIACAYR